MRLVGCGIVAVLVLMMSLAGGCASGDGGEGDGFLGYRSGGQFPEDVRTISLDVFDNRSFYRGFEFDLTEALGKQIELVTPYKVVARSRADTSLTGTIRSVEQRVLSRAADGGLPQEVQVTVVAGFEWKDLRSGEILRRRNTLTATGEYVPSRPVGEPFEIARHAAVEELARELVMVMRAGW
jgi:hypothetical protein